ncbi:MAG: LysM peptidoglycan-binding domain-containing protein [Candidatus Faecimonas sp.]|nr:LysM peptidoglycan-binding domain-containing protein [Mycoplasmatota bacterium]MDY2907761.1 LysM peptidoglycan-binding domain-containing protein [Candidatus Faecimonas sp.]
MRKVISFDKKLEFKTMIGEVTSISLDPNLKFSDDNDITGELVISGKYKLTAASRLEEDFLFSLPLEIALSEQLEEETRNVYVDDFRYDVDNDDDSLNCHIDLVVEGVEKIEVENEEIINDRASIEPSENFYEDSSLLSDEMVKKINDNQIVAMDNVTSKDDIQDDKIVENNSTYSLFSSFSDSDESFSTYSVYIVRENDTLESIMSKYKVHREELEDYNDLNNLMIGTKIIIPTHYE